MALRRFGSRVLLLGVVAFVGCRLSDDYYVDDASEDAAGFGSGGASGSSSSMKGGGFGGTAVFGPGGAGGKVSTAGAAGKNTCPTCEQNCLTETRGDHTYSICSTEATYADAQIACAMKGTKLVEINDAKEDAWVLDKVRFNYKGFQGRVYVGGTDAETEGEWTWGSGAVFWRGDAHGQPLPGIYQHWAAEQPDDYNLVTMSSEDCLTITLMDGTWNDVRCETPLPFVCESP